MLLLEMAIDEALRQEDKEAPGQKKGVTTLILNQDPVNRPRSREGARVRERLCAPQSIHTPR